jgi:hypothetical protein
MADEPEGWDRPLPNEDKRHTITEKPPFRTKEEGFVAIPDHFRGLTEEQFKAATRKALVKRAELARRLREERIEKVAHARIFEHKRNKVIAAELGITYDTFRNWCWRFRAELDAAITAAIDEVKQVRAGAALSLRAGMSEKVDDAMDVVGQVMAGTVDKPAKDAARLKAATTVIDYVDPPQKGGNTVNVNVFSEKAAALLKSVASQDLTPRKPLPRPREIEAEAEIVEEDDEA